MAFWGTTLPWLLRDGTWLLWGRCGGSGRRAFFLCKRRKGYAKVASGSCGGSGSGSGSGDKSSKNSSSSGGGGGKEKEKSLSSSKKAGKSPWKKGDRAEIYSTSKQKWLGTEVVKVHSDGTVDTAKKKALRGADRDAIRPAGGAV